MSFILSILIIGALLAIIFGRQVGAMFVTGAGALVIAGVGLVSIVFIWFVLANGFSSSSPASTSSSNSSYASTPAYGPSTPSQPYAPVTQAPASNYQAPAPLNAPGAGPRIGIDISPVPAYTVQQLTYLHVPTGAGNWITVHPDSPAASAGLQNYDVILAAGTQNQQADWITPSNQLAEYLDRVGYNVPVRLHIYRASGPSDFWVWVNPR